MKGKKTSKKKVKSKSKLKEELWSVFTLYRKLVNSDDGMWCRCISCKKAIRIGTRDCQGGHYHPKGGFSALYWEENNVWPQCFRCNIHFEGNTVEFGKALTEIIGQEAMDDMEKRKRGDGKFPRYWYEDKIKYYKEKVKEYGKLPID